MTFMARCLAPFLVGAAVALFGAAAFAETAARDGSRDFDFNLGVWHTHLERQVDPFSASSRVVRMDGTVTVRPLWDGAAHVEEIEAEGPEGHWEGLTLFMYNPQSRQWSQIFSNSAHGTLSGSLVGSFTNGRGELYSPDTIDGRAIIVRGTWSDITATSHRYEESFSDDGGRTWHTSISAMLTRDGPLTSAPPMPAGRDASHDFDFDIGTWATHSSRLLRPLTGSNEWVESEGTTVVSKIWNGRANIAQLKMSTGGAPAVQSLALRLYNPKSQQWSVSFAAASIGAIGVPSFGKFSGGRGEFYDYEEIGGQFVTVKFSIWPTSKDSAASEQAFSVDGGRTWEVNWKTTYTRIPDVQ